MAQSRTITYNSDLSGSVIKTETPTVEFGLDGTNYEIDLTEHEQKRLRDALAEYVGNARKAKTAGRPRKASVAIGGPAPADVRAWGKDNGLKVPDRGRIPKELSDAYAAAN